MRTFGAAAWWTEGALAALRRRAGRAHVVVRAEPFWRILYNHTRVTWAHLRQRRGLSLAFIWRTTRYLGAAYIGHSLSHVSRRDIVLSQAAYLRERVRHPFFAELVQPREALWRAGGARPYAIWLSANPDKHGEGDFDLAFRLDGVALYTLSFSIGPNLAQPDGGTVAMLVGRLQGERGRFGDIRLATKALRDISPATLLVSAAEGIALALDLPHICCVAGAEQLAHEKPGAEHFDYDRFWESLSGSRIGGWFQFDAPFPHKPSSQTVGHHRRRARQRREFRDAVREAVRVAFVERFVRKDGPHAAEPASRLGPWTDRPLARWAAAIAPLAFAARYWFWTSDWLPDASRYGRLDDIAIAVVCGLLSLRAAMDRR